jgi:hypothetical protein
VLPSYVWCVIFYISKDIGQKNKFAIGNTIKCHSPFDVRELIKPTESDKDLVYMAIFQRVDILEVV